LSVQPPIEPVVVPFSVTVFHWASRISLLSARVALKEMVSDVELASQATLPSGFAVQCASGVRAEVTCRTEAIALTDGIINATTM
jgi:hypothetical protein